MDDDLAFERPKRSRRASKARDESEEEEEVEAQDESEEQQDEEDEEEQEERPRGRRKAKAKPSPSKKKPRRSRSLSSDSEGEEESDGDSSSAGPSAPSTQLRDISASAPHVGPVAGVIQSIRLVNFMCHKNFEIEMNDHLNFIVGQNGSGKSAILTALQICLGARATSTQRGGSLKDLILTGQTQAIITVKIKNEGQDAFKPSLYGKSITIERKIGQAGSSYCLMNASGKTVCTKSQEVASLLTRLNIQIDNPCVILTQDHAKTFLAGSDDKQKYTFFMKATQIASIKEEYRNIHGLLGKMDRKLSMRKQELDTLFATYKKWEEKRKAAERLREIEERLVEVNIQIVWAKIAEQERKLQESQREIQMLEQKKQKLDERAQQMEADAAARDAEREKVTADINVYTAEASTKSNELHELRQAGKDVQVQLNEIDSDIKEIERNISTAKKEAQNAEKRVQEVQRASEVDVAGLNADRVRELESNEVNLAKSKESERRSAALLEQAVEEIRVLDAAVTELDENLKNADKNRVHSQQTIDQINASQSNRLRQFGDSMPEFLAAVGREAAAGRFSRPPIGPLGAVLSLSDPHWSAAVSTALKKELNAFIVHNFKDQVKLKDMAKSYRFPFGGISIFVQEFSTHEYDVRGSRPAQMTIEDVLRPDKANMDTYPIRYNQQEFWPSVINTLRDQSSIERTILIDEIAEGNKIMFHESHGNINKCYLNDGTSLFKRGMSEITHAPGNESSIRWGVDAGDQLRMAQTELRDRTLQCQQLSQQLKKANDDLTAAKGRAHRQDIILKSVRKAMPAMEQKIRQLQNPIVSENREEEIKDLKDELQTARQNLEKLLRDRDQLLEQKKIKKHEAAPHQRLIHEKEAELEAFKVKAEELSQMVSKLIAIMGEINKRARLKKQEANDVEQEIQPKRRAVEQLAQQVETQRTEASSIGERPAHIDNMQTLDTRRRKWLVEQEQRSKSLGEGENVSSAAVVEQFERIRQEYHKYRTSVATLIELKDQLQIMLEERYERIKTIRKDFCSVATNSFAAFLNARGHSGSLKFDHKEKELSLAVALESKDVRHASRANVVHDTKSLSGGERSFTTLCFLMALWQLVEAPFRILDEFDVFMDSRYREIAVRNLIEMAQEPNLKHHQYVFITPHEIAKGKLLANIDHAYRKLKPPRQQGQGQLDDYQGGAAPAAADDDDE